MDFETHHNKPIPSTQKGFHYWDLARVLAKIAIKSEEVFDYKKAFSFFAKAESFDLNTPEFWIEYGRLFYEFANLQGSSIDTKDAITRFHKAIFLSEDDETRGLAWEWFAKGSAQLFYLTEEDEVFSKADTAFGEAILAAPKRSILWLRWAELHYRYGLLTLDINSLENALDKLSSSKIGECSTISVLSLLSEVVAFLGFFLDKYPLLQEGLAQIESATSMAPDDPAVARSFGYVLLSFGHYFDDVRYFARAVKKFEQALDYSTFDPVAWEGIYFAYLAWGVTENNPYFLQKAIRAISRLIELRKESPSYLKEAGFAYLKLRKVYAEQGVPKQEEALHQAIHYLENAISLYQGEATEWVFHLGSAYDLLGELTEDEKMLVKAVDILEGVAACDNEFPGALSALALALSHLGALTGSVETLYHSLDLFEGALKGDQEDDAIWSEKGYARLVLAELVSDPLYPEKREELLAWAERDLLRGSKLGNAKANYDLACLYSLSGHFESSIDYLHRAENREALPEIEVLMQDRWLEKIRQTSLFDDFLDDLEER